MGSHAADSWAYGTVLRDNLDGNVAILLSAENFTPLGTLIGPPEIMWHYVLIASPERIDVRMDDEAYLLLYFQERLA